MTRMPLPARRQAMTQRVVHTSADADEQAYIVTFGAHDGRVMEIFCSSPKDGSDLQGMINDACIAISVLLQRGETADGLAKMFGENRAEGALSGLPSSPLGTIARVAATIDMEMENDL